MSDPLSSLYEQMKLTVPEEVLGGMGRDLDLEVDFHQLLHRNGGKTPDETDVRRGKAVPWQSEGEGIRIERPPAPAVCSASSEPPAASTTETPQKGPHGNRVPMERKRWNGTQSFTRLVIRPVTSMAAGLATNDTPVERVISSRGTDVPPLNGKKQGEADAPALWFEGKGKAGIRFFIFLTCCAVGLLLWKFAVGVLRFQNSTRAALVSAGEKMAPDAERQAAIRKSFDAFLAAGDPAGKLPWVLEPDRVGSRLKDYYEERHQKDPVILSYEVSPPQRAGNEWWFILQCVEKNGTLTSILMKDTPEGGRLDWENFVAYGSMAWEEFLAKKPESPQSMRVQMRPSNGYGGKYPAEDYLCYDISHRDSPDLIHGYVAKASRTGQRLAAMTPEAEWRAANLYLLWEADAGAPGSIVIADLIGNNWLDAINSSRMIPVPKP